MAESTPHGPSVAFGRIAAAIPVSDISRALHFYQAILGMSVTFTNGEPVGFVILKRDAAELHLTLVKGHKGGSHNTAHLMVADAAGLHHHLVSNDVRIIRACVTPTTGYAASSSPIRTATASMSGSGCRPVHKRAAHTRLTPTVPSL